MAGITIGQIGDKVLLRSMQCLKLYVGDVMVCYGYKPAGEPVWVTIQAVQSCFIVGTSNDCPDGKLWKLLPEHDDDFYAVLESPADTSMTISRKQYDRLLSESHFLSALIANGVDNWEGYDMARRNEHEDDDDDC